MPVENAKYLNEHGVLDLSKMPSDERKWFEVNGVLRTKNRRLYKAIPHILEKVGVAWFETNREEILRRYRAAVDAWARELYDTKLCVMTYCGYSDELKESLRQNPKVKVVEQDFINGITDRNHHFLIIEEYTTLRELSGDFEWDLMGAEEFGPPQLRYAARRQIGYLTKRKGVKVIFEGHVFGKNIPFATSVGKFLAHQLPCNYPSIVEAAVRRARFREEHPEFDCFQDTIYELYRMTGDVVLDYCNRVLSLQRQEQEEEDRRREENAIQMTDGRRYRIPAPRVNLLHDAMYPLEWALPYLTPAAAKRLLTFSYQKTSSFLERLMPAVNELRGNKFDRYSVSSGYSMTTKELRRLVRSIVLSADPKAELQAVMEKVHLELATHRNEADAKRRAKAMKRLATDNETIEAFIKRMHQYAEDASLDGMLRTFGAESAGRVFRGEYEGLFEPETFEMPLSFLSNEIRTAVGKQGKGATVKNPKRLFHFLSQLGDVREMVEGRFTDPQAVLQTLRHMGHDMPNAHEAAVTLRAVVEPKCSPEFLVAGNASVCCMSFGADNARQYARYKGFGLLNVYLGDRIIANSVLWINQLPLGRALVLDNIEVHPNYVRFNEYIRELYAVVMDSLMEKYDCIVTAQGARYNDLDLDVIEHPLSEYPWELNAVDVPTQGFSTDAYQVRVVATRQSVTEMVEWVNDMTLYRESHPTPVVFELERIA